MNKFVFSILLAFFTVILFDGKFDCFDDNSPNFISCLDQFSVDTDNDANDIDYALSYKGYLEAFLAYNLNYSPPNSFARLYVANFLPIRAPPYLS